MSSLDSREKLIDLEGKGRGKGKDKRAKGHEGKRAKGHKGKRAKTTNYNFPKKSNKLTEEVQIQGCHEHNN